MKTKIILFKLMIVFMSLIPMKSMAWHLERLIRINPGDTIHSSQLASEESGLGLISRPINLILIKNGGTFFIKMDNEVEGFSTDYDSYIDGRCVVIPNPRRHYIHYRTKGEDKLWVINITICYYGAPNLDGEEMRTKDTIFVSSDKDLEKVVSFPHKPFHTYFLDATPFSTFQYTEQERIINSDSDSSIDTFKVSLRELFQRTNQNFLGDYKTISITITFFGNYGVEITNPPQNEGLVIGPDGTGRTNEYEFIFTIKDNRTVSGISSTSVDALQKKSVIYDLQGRPISSPQKGIYIVNGKKVLYR